MRNNFIALLVGILFAVGLGISGMTQPQKIIGFLDVFGDWDPSLIFVMVGGILVHFVVYRLVKNRNSPFFSSLWHLPNNNKITLSLILGSMIFGVGWALGGYCPGPGLTSLASLNFKPIIFVVSMSVGMIIFRQFDQRFKINK